MLTLAPVSSSLIQFLPPDSSSLLNCIFIFNEHFIEKQQQNTSRLFKNSLQLIYIHKTKLFKDVWCSAQMIQCNFLQTKKIHIFLFVDAANFLFTCKEFLAFWWPSWFLWNLYCPYTGASSSRSPSGRPPCALAGNKYSFKNPVWIMPSITHVMFVSLIDHFSVCHKTT